jgi:hypothetical protein
MTETSTASWIEYVPEVTRPRAGEPLAIVGRGSALRLTDAALALIGTPSYVILHFDRVGRRVALSASSKEVRHAFPVRRYGSGTMWNVAAGGFIKWADISSEVRRDFPVKAISEHMIAFDLNEGAEGDGEFEEFTYKSVAIAQISPNVSISRNGNLTLNASSRSLAPDYDRFVLLYDPANRLVGLRPTTAGERHARPLRQSGSQRTWTISAAGFLKKFGIEHEHGRSYELTEQDGVLIIDLNKPKPPRRAEGLTAAATAARDSANGTGHGGAN